LINLCLIMIKNSVFEIGKGVGSRQSLQNNTAQEN